MSDALLSTKLAFPAVRPGLVPRPRLVRRLSAGIEGPLTLVSAPAGFGKTTLLGEWHSASANRDYPVAWLSLDTDDDSLRFWTYVVAALRTLGERGPDLDPCEALLKTEPPAPTQLVLTALLNSVAATAQHFALVLDDYHFIQDPAVHDGLAYLLDHLPQRMHLVILSRMDPPLPLGRLRARGQLTEIRGADLRFGPDEAVAFLNGTMILGLSAQSVAALEERTEGWIAGLQLAGLSLRGRDAESAERFILTFSGRQHYVLDFLIDEVLQRQSEVMRGFLLRTSILERLCAPLCDALLAGDGEATGADSPHAAQSILDYVEHANLFLVSLDDERRWYRYHHLFQEVLREELARAHPELVAPLHARASEWHEREGLVGPAVRHALAARHRERAADLVETHWVPSIQRGETVEVLHWLEGLPPDLVRLRPGLGLALGHVLYSLGRYREMETVLAATSDALAGPVGPDESPEAASRRAAQAGNVAVLRAFLARQEGDPQAAVEFAREALTLVPETLPNLRGLAYSSMASAYRELGENAKAIDANAVGIPLCWAGDNVAGAAVATFHQVKSLESLGQIRLAAATAREALRLAEQRGLRHSPAVGPVYLGLAEALYETNDLDGAERNLELARELGRSWWHWDLLRYGGILAARLRLARGDEEGALAAIERAIAALRGVAPTSSSAALAACQARIWCATDDIASAERWAEFAAKSENRIHRLTRQIEEIVIARVRISQRRCSEAIADLTSILSHVEAQGCLGIAVEILVLRALALAAEGRRDQALVDLERAIALAEPEGYVRVFLDEGAPMVELLQALIRQATSRRRSTSSRYVSELITASTSGSAHSPKVPRPTPAGQALPEPLTSRELEVLALLAKGLSNADIARTLVLSPNTLRTHTYNLYGKLGVHGRMQAVIRARAVGLLPPT